MYKLYIKKSVLALVVAAILLVAPFEVGAANDVVLNNVVNFSLDTLEAVPTIITAGSVAPTQQVTNLDVQSNYIDITLDNLSDITFNTTVVGQYLKITPTSDPNFTAVPACITNTVTLAGTGATTIVRLEVTATPPVCPGGITVSAISGNTTEAGATATFTVVLTSAPTADVTIGLSSSDLTEGTVLPASLTFTSLNWSTPQTVTVTGVNDAIVDGNITYTIITAAAVSADLNYNGINPADVSVVNIDNDSGGGGGGSGGGSVFPSNYSLIINNGDTCTTSSNVSLKLQATDTSQYEISNDSNLSGANWQAFNTSPLNLSWTLASGNGTKIVYALLKSNTSNLSPVISASINVNSAGCGSVPPVVPPGGQCTMDCTKISYDLYLVNPDGTERHINTNYARAQNIAPGIIQYSFEDKGVDFDYNDIVFKVDQSTCGLVSVQMVSKNSGWHHQIKIKLLYNGLVKDNLLLWSDDAQLAAGDSQTLRMSDYPDLCVIPSIGLSSGDLFKGSRDTVYYYGAAGKRYVFPNDTTYFTWYHDWSGVKVISDAALAGIPIADSPYSNVTFRPGVKMLKLHTDSKVYAVDAHGTLRWVTSAAVAEGLYGPNWQNLISDIDDAFFTDYKMGNPIYGKADFNPAQITALATSINVDKNLVASSVVSAPSSPVTEQPVVNTPLCQKTMTFTSFLSVGDNSPEVKALQKLLQCLNYFPANVIANGNFGPVTEAAVKKFQSAKGIEAKGYVGPATRAALNKY